MCIAKRLGFIYIDTGAMYRAAALYAIRKGLDPKTDAEAIRDILDDIVIDFKNDADFQTIFLNGEDVSGKIRDERISIGASDISAIPAVRDRLVELQREMARGKHVIMDGRDIGSNVFPDADVKIYLTASSGDRAKRRYEQLLSKGIQTDYETVYNDIKNRDYNDKNREYAPLMMARDAVLIDTTGNELEESIEIIDQMIRERLK